VRIGLLTEGGYPYLGGDAGLWCDRLVRGLGQHEFDLFALSLSERQEDEGWGPLPPQVQRVRTAPLWSAEDDGVVHGRRARRRFAECYGELAAVLCAGPVERLAGPAGRGTGPGSGRAGKAPRSAGAESAETAGAGATLEADRFANALYGLAELAREEGGLLGALRSETAVRALERACRAPRARRASPTCSPSPRTWNAPCAPCPSTGTRRTASAPSTCATRPPAAPRPSPDCSPGTSSTCPSW
jgi:hypothetical protein